MFVTVAAIVAIETKEAIGNISHAGIVVAKEAIGNISHAGIVVVILVIKLS